MADYNRNRWPISIGITNNLRLIDNAINNYVDFVKTGLAARVGQGLAFLFMESLGYHYHLSVGTYLGRNVIGIAPDYIFEDNSNTQVLMEAKGSFAQVGSQPAIKGNLSYALDQLAGYSASQIPNITKHYAVGGYLREEGDQHIEPSMIAFVDPDSESANGDIIRDEDFVRRGNYASWFRAMGFWNTAQRLESNKILKEKTTTKLPTFMFAGHRFAFVVNKVIALEESNPLAPFSDQFFWDNLSDLMLYPPNMVWRADEIVMEVTGIEVNILKKIGNVLIKDKSQALLDIPIVKIEPNSSEINNESLIRGSTFADGTFLGELVFSKKKKSPTIKIEDFVL